jgi:hypothetical protein
MVMLKKKEIMVGMIKRTVKISKSGARNHRLYILLFIIPAFLLFVEFARIGYQPDRLS